MNEKKIKIIEYHEPRMTSEWNIGTEQSMHEKWKDFARIKDVSETDEGSMMSTTQVRSPSGVRDVSSPEG